MRSLVVILGIVRALLIATQIALAPTVVLAQIGPGPLIAPLPIAVSPPIGTPTSFGATSPAGGATTATLTTTAAIVAGNLACSHWAYNAATGGATIASVSDGTNSYTKMNSIQFPGFDDWSELWCKANASAVASSASLTATMSSGNFNYVSVQTAQVSGVIPTSPLDQHPAGGSSSGTSATTTTGTLAQANEIAFGISSVFHGTTNGVSYSGASGFTNLGGTIGLTACCTAVIDYKKVAVTTAITYTPTWGSSGATIGAVATFKGY